MPVIKLIKSIQQVTNRGYGWDVYEEDLTSVVASHETTVSLDKNMFKLKARSGKQNTTGGRGGRVIKATSFKSIPIFDEILGKYYGEDYDAEFRVDEILQEMVKDYCKDIRDDVDYMMLPPRFFNNSVLFQFKGYFSSYPGLFQIEPCNAKSCAFYPCAYDDVKCIHYSPSRKLYAVSFFPVEFGVIRRRWSRLTNQASPCTRT